MIGGRQSWWALLLVAALGLAGIGLAWLRADQGVSRAQQVAQLVSAWAVAQLAAEVAPSASTVCVARVQARAVQTLRASPGVSTSEIIAIAQVSAQQMRWCVPLELASPAEGERPE